MTHPRHWAWALGSAGLLAMSAAAGIQVPPSVPEKETGEVYRLQDEWSKGLLAISPDSTRFLYRRTKVNWEAQITIDSKLLSVVDLTTGNRIFDIETSKYTNTEQGRAAFSPDNRYLAIAYSDNSVEVWDLATLVRKHRLTGVAYSYCWRFARFKDRTVLLGFLDRGLQWMAWDLETGEREKFLDYERFGLPRELAFSRDRRFAAQETYRVLKREWLGVHEREIHYRRSVHLYDMQTGDYVGQVGAAKEGMVVSWRGEITKGEDNSIGPRVGSAESGFRVRITPTGAICLFPPIVRHLTFACRVSNGKILPREIVTGLPGKTIAPFSAKEGGVREVILAANGRLLAASAFTSERTSKGPEQSAVIVYDLAEMNRRLPPPNPHPPQDELTKLWSELGHADVSIAHRAANLLAHAPVPVRTLVRDHLVERADRPENAALLDLLRQGEPSAADRAERELMARGAACLHPLLVALADNPPADAKRRMVRIVRAFVAGQDAQEAQLRRACWCLDILEFLGDGESQALLEQIVQNHEDEWLRREAKASLVRTRQQQQELNPLPRPIEHTPVPLP